MVKKTVIAQNIDNFLKNEQNSNARTFINSFALKLYDFKSIIINDWTKIIYGVKFCTEVWVLVKNGVKIKIYKKTNTLGR